MPINDSDRILRNVGRRIAELRTDKKMTQEQLATRAGVSLKYLQRLEAGSENLTLRSLVEWANTVRVKLPALLEPPRSREVRRGRPPSRSEAD